METASGTAALRAAAPEWSLAGDRQLLDILQNLHQKIMSRCQETNSKLDEMVSTLDGASVSLQNVNNRFMSLSNSQFVESRVLEDDDAAPAHPPASPRTSPRATAAAAGDVITDQQSERETVISSVSLGVATVARAHESVLILDSDSDSDSDQHEAQHSVLKPIDAYASRPLPHVIGSHGWKTKWHAGLVAESDSDSDTTSDRASDAASDVSDRASDVGRPPSPRQYTESMTSSEVTSELDARRTQQRIAADLARRLGGGSETGEIESACPIGVETPRPPPSVPYTPRRPPAGAVFPDEPPPLDAAHAHDSDIDTYTHDDNDYDNDTDNDDIFAEINKNAPYAATHKRQTPTDDIFADVKVETGVVKEKGPLFDERESSDLFTDASKGQAVENVEAGIKKPIGAISLFGTNTGAESIGAAILNRARSKPATTDDDSRLDNKRNKDVVATTTAKLKDKPTDNNTEDNIDETPEKERDIFDDLFARSEKANKAAAKSEKRPVPVEKVDIFSDNIFDDIDDIFSSNVVIKKAANDVSQTDKSKEKSLFDDVDDLFADIGIEKTEARVVKVDNKTKDIFESDDELFGSKNFTTSQDVDQLDKNARSLSKNREIETENNQNKKNEVLKAVDPISSKNDSFENATKSESLFESDDELFSGNEATSKKEDKIKKLASTNSNSNKTEETKKEQKNWFDDDDDNENDIFSTINAPKTNISEVSAVKLKSEDSPVNQMSDEQQNKQNNNSVIRQSLLRETKISNDIPDQVTDDNNHENINERKPKDIGSEKKSIKTSSIFDENVADIDNLFDKPKASTTKDVTLSQETINNNVDPSKNKNTSADNKNTGLFDSDNDSEDIFTTVPKNENKTQLETQTNSEDVQPKDKNSNTNQEEPTLPEELETVSIVSDTVTENLEEKRLSEETQSHSMEQTEIILDNTQENLDKNKNLENCLFNAQKESNTNEEKADIFSDLFLDQPPPVFEKPKEPKKSKNVNALFDDDSDDETLFFKKNDNFTDDNISEDFTPGNTEPLFAIFHDEPPAINTDFIQKDNEKVQPPMLDTSSELAKEFPEKSAESIEKQSETSRSGDRLDGVTQSKEDEKPKPVGKLKPMNFNINVNTLLPGASPKKIPKVNKTADENTTKSTPESPTENLKPALVKSVSFEGDPESPILDNKISKGRAKIQVKRRPSTRRARIEAVRKSGIDFGDEIDGSGDKTKVDGDDNVIAQKQDKENELENLADTIASAENEVSENTQAMTSENVVADMFVDNLESSGKIEENSSLFNADQDFPAPLPPKINSVHNTDEIPVISQEILKEILEENRKTTKDNTKTEVLNINADDVYIFRDPNVSNAVPDSEEKNEDGVRTLGKVYTVDSKINENKQEQNSTEPTNLKNLNETSDDGDDIFKEFSTKSVEAAQDNLFVKSTKTLPKISKSLFDDLSDDDDLFGGNKTTKSQKNTFSRADDSDEELFASKKKPYAKVDKDLKVTDVTSDRKPVEVKKSLFGDEDDDDNLFGVIKKTDKQTKANSVEEKKTRERQEKKQKEDLFQDPLTFVSSEDGF